MSDDHSRQEAAQAFALRTLAHVRWPDDKRPDSETLYELLIDAFEAGWDSAKTPVQTNASEQK